MKYKEFTIEIHQDISPENPFEAWDGNAPIAVSYDRYITEYPKDGNLLDCPTLTKSQIKLNMSYILSMLNFKSVKELVRNFRDEDTTAVGCINFALANYVAYCDNDDRLEALRNIYDMVGIPAICKASRGYSQGDYALVLAVATKEFQELCGEQDDWNAVLKSGVDLYSAWAWGDVYGWEIPELGESVWGFYGDDHEKSGLLESARDTIDAHLSSKLENRLARVKRYVKEKVPLIYRKLED